MSSLRPRGVRPYSKPALDDSELLGRWTERGLVITDAARATRYLRHIGYFRLSAYVRSFEGGVRDQLRAGTTFDQVLDLYVFDRKLRLLVLDAIERVEVAVRASLNDRMGVSAGPHWYENPSHFSQPGIHARLLKKVDELVDRQRRRAPERAGGREGFVSAMEHYVTVYGTPARPPCWLVFEELSLGSVRTIYSALADPSQKGDIARSLGLTTTVLDSWLLTYQRVRNISAHHGRLWNRGLGVYPVIPKSTSIAWLHDRRLFAREPWRGQRLYPVLVSLQTLLHTISPGSAWAGRLADLLAQHHDVPLSAMGIPPNWSSDPFWPRRPR